MSQNEPACRKQYGALNYSEGGTPDEYGGWESALRDAATKFNVGSVYVNSTADKGGVKAGDNGLMPTRNMWYGVLHANLAPVGLTAGQTYLFQAAGNPNAWAGDTPVDLQPSTVRAAPWLRVTRANVRS